MAARFGWNGALVAMALTVAPAVAVAQDAEPADEPELAPALVGWNKFCNPDPVTAQEGCVVVFQAVRESGAFVARLSLSYLVEAPDNIILSLMVPIGVLLEPGLQLQVDQREPVVLPYVICEPTVCRSEREVDQEFVGTLKAGGVLTLSFIQPNFEEGGAVRADIPITLIGFTAAFDGPGRTPEEAAALQDRAEEARQRLIEQQQQLNEN